MQNITTPLIHYNKTYILVSIFKTCQIEIFEKRKLFRLFHHQVQTILSYFILDTFDHQYAHSLFLLVFQIYYPFEIYSKLLEKDNREISSI